MHVSQRQRKKRVKANRPKTFSAILDQARVDAARAAWKRARTASALRHEVNKLNQFRAARILSTIKIKSVRRAFEVAPEVISIVIDDDFQIGLLSVRCDDGSRLHLPSATNACAWEPVGRNGGIRKILCPSAA
tara:strand:+ start:237 stop:635 length:399 start_codon:yes stop_codon:yes gene_type:complete